MDLQALRGSLNPVLPVKDLRYKAEFTIPLLAIFALKRLLEEPEILKQEKTMNFIIMMQRKA